MFFFSCYCLLKTKCYFRAGLNRQVSQTLERHLTGHQRAKASVPGNSSFPRSGSFFLLFQPSAAAEHQPPTNLLLHTANFMSSFATSINQLGVGPPGRASSPQSQFSSDTSSALCPSDVLNNDHRERLDIYQFKLCLLYFSLSHCEQNLNFVHYLFNTNASSLTVK